AGDRQAPADAGRRARVLAAHGGAMSLRRQGRAKGITRRDLIKRFGVSAFALTPVARAMGYVAGGAFAGAPRFVMFFKGGSFHSPSTKPASLADLSATPIAPLQPHVQDLILFQGMSIHGGSPKTDG